jgi:nucleotide-binding universal stress UspA family protein
VENGTAYFQAQFAILKQQALSEGVAARFEIRVGHPAQEIVMLAEAEGADAIVVGHRGQSRLQQWLLGSVAKRVLAYAKCHVIVAH